MNRIRFFRGRVLKLQHLKLVTIVNWRMKILYVNFYTDLDVFTIFLLFSFDFDFLCRFLRFLFFLISSFFFNFIRCFISFWSIWNFLWKFSIFCHEFYKGTQMVFNTDANVLNCTNMDHIKWLYLIIKIIETRFHLYPRIHSEHLRFYLDWIPRKLRLWNHLDFEAISLTQSGVLYLHLGFRDSLLWISVYSTVKFTLILDKSVLKYFSNTIGGGRVEILNLRRTNIM